MLLSKNFLVTMSHQLNENLVSHQLIDHFMNVVRASSGLNLRMLVLKTTQLEEKDGQIQKEKKVASKIIKELQEKLYKIGQSEQTIFFEQTKNVKRILFKGWTMF